MRLKNPLKFGSLKLHTKTTIFISAVLIVVFAIIAYFYDEFTTNLSKGRELAWAQVAAHRVADTVEYHIKRGERKKGKETSQDEGIDGSEVQENINSTVMKTNPQRDLMTSPPPWEVGVFRILDSKEWKEEVRLPEEAGPPFLSPPFQNAQPSGILLV